MLGCSAGAFAQQGRGGRGQQPAAAQEPAAPPDMAISYAYRVTHARDAEFQKTLEGFKIFDDLYLGVRAGGALRKKRRGELLTAEEAEALSRWERLSAWRKGVAVGGFAAGTFGLGFTLGGLVFGRWRKG